MEIKNNLVQSGIDQGPHLEATKNEAPSLPEVPNLNASKKSSFSPGNILHAVGNVVGLLTSALSRGTAAVNCLLSTAAGLFRSKAAEAAGGPPIIQNNYGHMSSAELCDHLITEDKYGSYDKFADQEVEFTADIGRLVDHAFEGLPPEANTAENKEVLTNEIIQLANLLPDDRSAVRNEEFSAIKEVIKTRIDDCCNLLTQVAGNVKNDQHELHATFFPGQPADNLSNFTVKLTNGETHNHGKRVCFVKFENIEQPLVYKPRSVEVDALICGQKGSLFSTIDPEGKLLPISYNFLQKESYGYSEFLCHKENDYTLNMNEMKDYYKTMGAIQAISQAFGIRDLHYENVLVHDKKPFLIDLEVAFNLKSLTDGDQKGQTELSMAVSKATHPQTGEATSNKVVLRNEDGSTMPLQDHYDLHRETYIAQMQEGFEEAKRLMQEHKEDLFEFINNLSDEIPLRFVPVKTGDLVSTLETNHPSKCTSKLLNCMHLTPGDEEHTRYYDQVGELENLSAPMHHDIPVMYTNLKGEISCEDTIIYRKKTEDSMKNILMASVDAVESMEMEASFEDSINKAFK